jgi:hypothetical protein
MYFRTDAGFANPEVSQCLEAERIKYAIRLRPTDSTGSDRLRDALKDSPPFEYAK